jgi:hypothetical protein
MLHRHLSNFGEKFNCDAQVLDFGVPSHVPSSGLLKHYCLQSVANFSTKVGNPGLLLSTQFMMLTAHLSLLTAHLSLLTTLLILPNLTKLLPAVRTEAYRLSLKTKPSSYCFLVSIVRFYVHWYKFVGGNVLKKISPVPLGSRTVRTVPFQRNFVS